LPRGDLFEIRFDFEHYFLQVLQLQNWLVPCIRGASGFPGKQDSEIAPRRRSSTSLRTGSGREVKSS
jgi:hypothetical protein